MEVSTDKHRLWLPGVSSSSQGFKKVLILHCTHSRVRGSHPKSSLQTAFGFLKLSPFRKFSFLSPLRASITFPSRGETARLLPRFIKSVQSLFVAVTGSQGRLGALSAVQPASGLWVRGSPYICFSMPGRAKGAPQSLMRLTLGIMDRGEGLRETQLGLAVKDGAHPAGHPPHYWTPPQAAQ